MIGPLEFPVSSKIGLAKTSAALSKTINADMIQESFKKCGIFDPDLNKYNVQTILGAVRHQMSPEQLQTIMANLPTLTEMMATFGELKDDDFTSCGIIPTVESTNPKDSLVLNQRRALICTNRILIESEKAKKEAKAAQQAAKESRKRKRN